MEESQQVEVTAAVRSALSFPANIKKKPIGRFRSLK
jgi:hypothetical protein